MARFYTLTLFRYTPVRWQYCLESAKFCTRHELCHRCYKNPIIIRNSAVNEVAKNEQMYSVCVMGVRGNYPFIVVYILQKKQYCRERA